MKNICSGYIIDFTDGTREEVDTLENFYKRYKEIQKNGEQNSVDRWCTVNGCHHITSLSSYGLKQLFIWAVEPQTGGYVIYQNVREKPHFLNGKGVNHDLKNALVLNEKEAKRRLLCNKLYIDMIPCTVAEREAGKFNQEPVFLEKRSM